MPPHAHLPTNPSPPPALVSLRSPLTSPLLPSQLTPRLSPLTPLPSHLSPSHIDLPAPIVYSDCVITASPTPMPTLIRLLLILLPPRLLSLSNPSPLLPRLSRRPNPSRPAPSPSPSNHTPRPSPRCPSLLPLTAPTLVANPPKNPLKLSLGGPTPSGGRAAERQLPPSPPTKSHPRLAEWIQRPRRHVVRDPPPPAVPRTTPHQPTKKAPRRTSRVFWKKLLMRTRPPIQHPPNRPTPRHATENPIIGP